MTEVVDELRRVAVDLRKNNTTVSQVVSYVKIHARLMEMGVDSESVEQWLVICRDIASPTSSGKQFASAAEELFWKIVQMADNAGATDEHRAMNYLAVRYPAIYAKATECYGRDSSLTAVEVRPSRLSGVRKIVDVIFSYTNRKTDVTEKYFARVDVTEAFPFLVTKMSAYYDR